MRVIRRGFRNLYRGGARSAIVVLIVALSIATFVTMLRASSVTQARADEIRADAGTLLQVVGAGSPGGGGIAAAATTLPESLVQEIVIVPGVVRVELYLRRGTQDSAKPFQMGIINGVRPGDTLLPSAMGGFVGNPDIIQGRLLEPADEGKRVAVVGKTFAQQYGVRLGEEFVFSSSLLRREGGKPEELKELRLAAAGLYATDVVFGDNQLFVPLDVLQGFLGKEGEVTQLIARVDRAENVARVAGALRALVGERADVLPQSPQAQRAADTLSSIGASSLLAAATASIVGALVVLFVAILATRRRTREIGTLKAIGASNGDVAWQFLAESLAVAIAGAVLGVALAGIAGSLVATAVLGSGGSSLVGSEAGSLSPLAAAYALGLAAIFAVLGALYPVWRAIRMRPAEALRYE